MIVRKTNLVTMENIEQKAAFVKRPEDPYDERMEKLYKIRPFGRIEKSDVDEIW